MVFGYLDPGTGSMIIQAVLGAIAGIAIFFKFFWGRIVSFFKRPRTETPAPNEETVP